MAEAVRFTPDAVIAAALADLADGSGAHLSALDTIGQAVSLAYTGSTAFRSRDSRMLTSANGAFELIPPAVAGTTPSIGFALLVFEGDYMLEASGVDNSSVYSAARRYPGSPTAPAYFIAFGGSVAAAHATANRVARYRVTCNEATARRVSWCLLGE